LEINFLPEIHETDSNFQCPKIYVQDRVGVHAVKRAALAVEMAEPCEISKSAV